VSGGLVCGKKCAAVLLGRAAQGLQEPYSKVQSPNTPRSQLLIRRLREGEVCVRVSSTLAS
jgi:hypothetical protein